MKILIVIVLVLFVALLWDVKKGKIPNLLILVGAGYGLLRLFYYQKILYHIPGILIPVILLYPLYKIGTIGAGDLKLYSVLGFYFPFMEVAYCMFLSFVVAAVYSIFLFHQNGNFKERLYYFISYLKDVIQKGKLSYYYTDQNGIICSKEDEVKTKIHMAVPIFISVVIHLGGGIL